MVPEENADVTIPIPEEDEWLFKITKKQDSQSRYKPRIQKVPETLCETESNRRCFKPRVVSLGPYHHGEDPFKLMERYKEVAARWFLSLAAGLQAEEITKEQAKHIYRKFIGEAQTSESPSLRDCYADKMDKYNDADFMKMMFLDGCFILHFIHLVVEESKDHVVEEFKDLVVEESKDLAVEESEDPVVEESKDLSKSSHCLNQPLIIRDMFLLENQIPYSILQNLMSFLTPNRSKLVYWMMDFIDMVFIPSDDFNLGLTPYRKSPISILKLTFVPERQDMIDIIWGELFDLKENGQPLHLLDLLRTVLVGRGNRSPTPGSGYWNYYFRPISELKEAGIQVSRSHSLFRDVEFKKGAIYSRLELPPIIVDDSTKTHMLNLVAYEMCPDGLLDRGVTSYICFLDSLIYNVVDVKELRSNNILFNRLGSDEEVANLFKELATNLSPDYTAYGDIIRGIEGHSKRHFNGGRSWIGQLIRTYFTSPWTAIPLTAAIFVIIFALVQTMFTVWSFYERK